MRYRFTKAVTVESPPFKDAQGFVRTKLRGVRAGTEIEDGDLQPGTIVSLLGVKALEKIEEEEPTPKKRKKEDSQEAA